MNMKQLSRLRQLFFCAERDDGAVFQPAATAPQKKMKENEKNFKKHLIFLSRLCIILRRRGELSELVEGARLEIV